MTVTEKTAFSAIKTYPKLSDTEAASFLDEGASDTRFLRENGISIVYSRREANNPDLAEVKANAYLLNK